ncbi:helix-turn-helix domain-containing protein [Lactobacillus sp. PV034]|uniref:helix-turn-helix domain-containing protein n=1 Tax=Lactobacillus sp. PV034 TaxID=2594495 RepID=UPI00223F30BC|nr:helix-turn-helix transcriptional regulator [Lactobacillus sp. PV034]QNQ80514.1 helix-turn-helix transcriptional regulator [Lactobacillus sp. PV034]
MNTWNDQIRKNLSFIRKIKGISQEQLGKKVGISGAAIGNYERGDRYIPAYLIHELSVALDIPDSFLSNKVPKNITRRDIKNENRLSLEQKTVNIEKWKEQHQGKYIQTIQLMHILLKDMYEELYLNDSISTNYSEVIDIFVNFFDNLEWNNGELDSYEDNLNLIYDTALFFFNYLIEQHKLYKDIDLFKNYHFREKYTQFFSENENYVNQLWKYDKDLN